MANGTYRYNVVVEVSIETGKAAQGKQAARAELRNWEKEQIDSARRVNDEHSRMAQMRYNDKVADYHRQVDQTRSFNNAEIEHERMKNQSIANDNRNFHQQRFNDQKQAYEKQLQLDQQNHKARTDLIMKAGQQVYEMNEKIRKNDPFQNLGNRNLDAQTAAMKLSSGERIKSLQQEIGLRQQISQLDPFQNLGSRSQSASQSGAALRAEELKNVVTGLSQVDILNQKILKSDPFQNLGNRQLNPFQAGSKLRIDEDARFKQSILDKDPFQNAKNLNFEQTRQELARLDSSVAKSSQGLGMWGQAFKGAFIGAVAGLTFSVLIGSFTGLISKVVDLGVASVKMSADFEATRNAMTLFTGSSARADAELSKLAKTAYETPGLTLDDAQIGATRLRALGFEAQTTSDIVQGLAKQKLISGVTDEGAVQRVIVNLQQLRAGSPQVQRDIQQMILSLPSLSIQINRTFGSLTKFKAALREDAQGAIDKFAKGLADVKSPAGGFNVALENLIDTFTLAGREFGTPILDPLSTTFKGLTELIKQNESTWKSWGQTVADIIRGLNSSDTPTSITSNGKGYLRYAAGLATYGLSEVLYQSGSGVIDFYRSKGEKERKASPYSAELQELGLDKNFLNRPLAGRNLYNISTDLSKRNSDVDVNDIMSSSSISTFESRLNQLIQKRSANDNELDEASRLDKLEREKEQSRQKELAKIDAHYSQIKNIRENAFNLEVAQNQDNAEKVFQITDRNYSQQIKETADFYNKKIGLADGDQLEIYKLTVESNNAIRDLENKQAIDRLNFEREQIEKRRQNLIEFKELQRREITDLLDRESREIERGMQRGTIEREKGYDQQIDLVGKRENLLSSIIRDQFNLRLQDKSLTDQQIVNLEKERDLELASLADESLQKVRDIEDAKSETIIKNLTFQREATRETYQVMSSFAAQFQQDFFNPDTFGGNALTDFKRFVLKSDQTDPLKTKIKQANEISKGFEEQLKAKPSNFEPLYEGFIKAGLEASKFESELKKIEDSIPKNYKLFAEIAGQIGVVEGAFDKLNAAILKHRQALDTNDAVREIEYWEAVIKNTTDADKKREATFNLQKARNSKERLEYDQNIEKADQYRHSLEGINAEIQQLLSNDPQKVGSLKDIFTKGRGEDTIKLLEQIKMLEFDIASPDINAQYQIRAAVLQHIIDLRNEETEAISRTMIAQLDFERQFTYSQARADASLAEFLGSQRGFTEILSDARINSIKVAYDGLDKIAGSLAKNFGFAADAVKDLISGLLRLGLNSIFRKLLGGNAFGGNGGSGSNQSGGGFSIPGLFGNGGGGGGFFGGGTPLFNPNAGSGVGGGNFAGLIGAGQNSGLLHESGNHGMLGAGMSQTTQGAGGLGGFMGAIKGNPLLLPLLGGLLGSRFGGSSMTGKIVGGIGGGLIGLGATFGMLGPAALIGIPLLIGAFFLGRNAARRRDETTRNQAMIDAFKQLDDLIAKVSGDQIDGDSAISQAEQIRVSYLESMGQLKDKKTRNIALKDVSRIDAKIDQLKAAVATQSTRRDRLALSVPTFADGGTVSRFARNNFRHNPLGYQRGVGTGREDNMVGYFPSSNEFARYSNTEYIFDAETTRNIGTMNLDLMRQTKGKSFNDMLSRNPMKQRADGGAVGFSASGTPGAGTIDLSKLSLVLNLNLQLGMETLIEVVSAMIKENNGSVANITGIATTLKKEGDNELLRIIQDSLNKNK